MGNLDALLREEPISAYWLGLLMSDGTFSSKRVRLALSIKDRQLVERFADFIGAKEPHLQRNGTVINASLQNPVIIPTILSRFQISTRKTYEPPLLLPYKNTELLICFLIGFIDGDGSICKQSGGRRDAVVRIKVHSSWKDFLNELATKCCRRFTSVTTKAGYYELRICDNTLLAQLKRTGIQHSLPMLDRKWKHIDENFKLKYNKNRCNTVRQMILEGKSGKRIREKTGMSYPQISNIKRRLRR